MSDELYATAKDLVLRADYCSASLLQTALRITYGRAVSLIDLLESTGVIGPAVGPAPRSVRPVLPPATSGNLFP